jgi:hypothetical protein
MAPAALATCLRDPADVVVTPDDTYMACPIAALNSSSLRESDVRACSGSGAWRAPARLPVRGATHFGLDAADSAGNKSLLLSRGAMASQAENRQARVALDPRHLKAIGFHLLVPFALSLLTATETGYNRLFGYAGAVVYVSLFSFIPWWTAEAATRAVRAVLSPWRPRLWTLTLVGALVACAAVFLYSPWLVRAFFALNLPNLRADLSAVEAHGSWAESAMQSARAVAFWMGANHAFDRYLGFPRFRYESKQTQEPQHEAATGDNDRAVPGADSRARELLARLTRFSSLDQVTAIKAEEHYVRVFGDGIEEMILYRFGRILVDLEKEDGFRVHRSHWVRRSAIAEKRTDGSRVALILKDGSVIPVSRRYHELVEQVMKTLKRPRVD